MNAHGQKKKAEGGPNSRWAQWQDLVSLCFDAFSTPGIHPSYPFQTVATWWVFWATLVGMSNQGDWSIDDFYDTSSGYDFSSPGEVTFFRI